MTSAAAATAYPKGPDDNVAKQEITPPLNDTA